MRSRHLYVATWRHGIVKVGITSWPDRRRVEHTRAVGAPSMWHVVKKPAALGVERSLINRLSRIGSQLPGHLEYFSGVRFAEAVQIAEQISRGRMLHPALKEPVELPEHLLLVLFKRITREALTL